MENEKTSRLIEFLVNVKEEALECEKTKFAGYGSLAAMRTVDAVINKILNLESLVADQDLMIDIMKAELDEYHDRYGEITYEAGESDGK